MIKRSLLLVFFVLLAACRGQPSELQVAENWATKDWRSDTPESQGMDAAVLAQGIESVAKNELPLHSLLVIRHGVIVSETYFSPYKANTLHELYSVTKSFTATLVGIALDQ